MKVLSSYTHTHVILNLYDFLLWKTTEYILNNVLTVFINRLKVKRVQNNIYIRHCLERQNKKENYVPQIKDSRIKRKRNINSSSCVGVLKRSISLNNTGDKDG